MTKENSEVGKVKGRKGNMESLKKMKEIAYGIQQNYERHPIRHRHKAFMS